VSAIAPQYWQTGGLAPPSRTCRAMPRFWATGRPLPACRSAAGGGVARAVFGRLTEAAARCALRLLGGEQGEQGGGVLVELGRADPLDREQLTAAAGPAVGEREQGAVVEDHVGGHAVGLGTFLAPATQGLDQRPVRAQPLRGRPADACRHRPGPDPRAARGGPVGGGG